MRVFSFGGGVQSVSALVLASQGKIDYQTFVFANVGEDSENPDTITYFHEIAIPFAKEHNLRLEEIRRVTRDGRNETIYEWLMKPSRSIGIPVRMASGAPGNRSCTPTFKIRVVSKWLKSEGATAKNPAVLGMGISMDEFHRMRSDSRFKHYTLDYPLIDLRLTRAQCVEVIKSAGLPVPPKSSCWFCPYHKNSEWREMAVEHPDRFAASVELENILNERRDRLGKDHVYLSGFKKPLNVAITVTSEHEDDTTCDSGFCFL